MFPFYLNQKWAVGLCLAVVVLLERTGQMTAQAQYRFDHWTADNGLPQNSVRDIVQTRDGYLWLTMLDSLLCFDGGRFTVFNYVNTLTLIMSGARGVAVS